MRNQSFPLLRFVWLLFVFTLSLRADPVLDDLFADNNRSNQALPGSAAWFYSGSVGTNLVATNSSLVWTSTPSAMVLGYFTPQTVATGESITLSFTFSVTSPVAAVQSGIRLALLNSNSTRVAADGYGTSNVAFQGYAGYGAYIDAGYLSETEAQLFRRAAGTTTTANNLLGAGYPTMIGGKGPGAQLVAGKSYEGILTIRNNGTTSSVTFSLNGVVLSTTDTVHYTTFDTVALFLTQGMLPSCKFTEISVNRAVDAGFPAATASTTPVAVPTFESLGLYWSPAGAAPDNACQMSYRVSGTSTWSSAQPLVYDARNNEYRGSIVSLKSNTSYEVKLLLGTGATSTITAKTWNETFPIASTVTLSSGVSSATYTIATGGSASGYVLYVGASDGSTVIDVNNLADNCVSINASYVILRNVTLKGAKLNGVLLHGAVHDVVIEKNDISGWGRISADGWGTNLDSGIRADDAGIYRIIVQRNKIHNPRSNSNDWSQSRTWSNGTVSAHPMGAQGITFFDCVGNHVIRYNEIYSDDTHRFNDGMGGYANFSYYGFPGRDSDVYGNIIRNACDDALEIEGGGCNVRIWSNYMDTVYTGVASACCSVGPLYIYRNVLGVCGMNATGDRGIFAKIADQDSFGMGHRFLFHNTILQPTGSSTTMGAQCGISTSWTAPLTNTTSYNNIWHITTGQSKSTSITDTTRSPMNDYDYDLCNGTLIMPSTQETHKVVGVPVYAAGHGPTDGSGGHYALSSTSPGYDKGVVLANFNDNFTGAAPDMGAHEAGTAAMQFGVNATGN